MDDLIKLKDTAVKIPDCRAYAGEGAIAFAPSIISGKLTSSFVIWEYPTEKIELTEVDTSDRIIINSDMSQEFDGFSTGVIVEVVG